MSNVRITDKDLGFKALFKRLEGKARVLSVGILSESEGAPDGNATVGDVAAMVEFGIGQPERSFIRGTVDERQADIVAMLREIGRGVLKGSLDQTRGLGLAGAKIAGMIQSRMAGGIPPPNAESTIRKKGSSTPTIDKGILRFSVSWKVE